MAKANPMKMIKNFKLDRDSDGIAWLYFDAAGASANVLSEVTLNELDKVIDILREDKPKGLVIASAKSSGFIAGADIKEFVKLTDHNEAYKLIRRGQSVLERIEALPYPTVAMIRGFCLGGGLELALACRYRVASDDDSTKLGLPEVMLGIHPGFGGTVRLTRLVDLNTSMDMILTGRSATAKKAYRKGLIDYAVPDRHLEDAARKCLLGNSPRNSRGNSPRNSKKRKLPLLTRIMSHRKVRPYVAKNLHKKVEKRAPLEHYPAPHAVIDIWSDHFDDAKKMYEAEAWSVADLIIGETAKNLVRLFFLRERLKGLGKTTEFKAERVHVIGAGVMGGDIAAWCALRGMRVTLQDREAKFIAPAVKRAHDLFKKKLKEPRLVRAAMDRFQPDVGGEVGIKAADIIIEAIFEDRAAKRELFKSIDKAAKRDAIIATNTSSIPIEELSDALKDPARLVGIHFFNPVAKMQLIEIVAGKETGEDVIKNAEAFAVSIGRLPLPVKSSPGFLVNRVLMPYILEAITMVEEGASVEAVDRAAKKFGMPMGPILLADTVGLDICLHVGEVLAKSLDVKVPKSLKEMVSSGKLGRKKGVGFYKYKGGKQVGGGKTEAAAPRTTANDTPEDTIDRLILSMCNEAVACLAEGVVEDSDLLDAAMVFGTGFAPFRGGPLNYASARGTDEIIEKLKELQAANGERFHPNDGWPNKGWAKDGWDGVATKDSN